MDGFAVFQQALLAYLNQVTIRDLNQVTIRDLSLLIWSYIDVEGFMCVWIRQHGPFVIHHWPEIHVLSTDSCRMWLTTKSVGTRCFVTPDGKIHVHGAVIECISPRHLRIFPSSFITPDFAPGENGHKTVMECAHTRIDSFTSYTFDTILSKTGDRVIVLTNFVTNEGTTGGNSTVLLDRRTNDCTLTLLSIGWDKELQRVHLWAGIHTLLSLPTMFPDFAWQSWDMALSLRHEWYTGGDGWIVVKKNCLCFRHSPTTEKYTLPSTLVPVLNPLRSWMKTNKLVIRVTDEFGMKRYQPAPFQEYIK